LAPSGGRVKYPIHSALALSLIALMAAGTAQGAAAPAHVPAKRASAAAAGALPGGMSPFWTGRPNAQEFARRERLHLQRSKQAIARMLAAKGPRTIANTLRPFDDSQLELDAMLSQSSLMENVH